MYMTTYMYRKAGSYMYHQGVSMISQIHGTVVPNAPHDQQPSDNKEFKVCFKCQESTILKGKQVEFHMLH